MLAVLALVRRVLSGQCLPLLCSADGLFRNENKQKYGLFSSWIKCANQGNTSGIVTTFYVSRESKYGVLALGSCNQSWKCVPSVGGDCASSLLLAG